MHRLKGLAVGTMALLLFTGWCPPLVHAQTDRPNDNERRSSNVELVSVLPLADLPATYAAKHAYPEVKLDQEEARPYAYVATAQGFLVLDIDDPRSPSLIREITVPASHEAHVTDLQLATVQGRHVLIASMGNVTVPGGHALYVYDVSLPRVAVPEMVAAYSLPESGGLENIFAYQHSSGTPLLFAAGGRDLTVFDLARFGTSSDPIVARYPTPELLDKRQSGFDDVYASFEPESGQDRMYGAGAGGYYVYNVTDLSAPSLLARIDAAAVPRGTRISASPDGRYLVTAAGYRTTPVYIFDIVPTLEGRQPSVRTAVGAWTANWRNRPRAFEVRWPYVFVAALHDGFYMFNMRDPEQPYTVAFVITGSTSLPRLSERDHDDEGAWGVDVRNADGLIAVTDRQSGVWLLTVEGFEGWHGRGWGVPNSSSVQNWTNGQGADGND